MTDRPIVIVSNRGPISYRRDESGALVGRRGSGGLVSGLAPIVAATDAMWIAAAISDEDRAATDSGLPQQSEGPAVRLVSVDPDDYRMAYGVIANSTLWYLHHHLWDLSRLPRFDARWHEAWGAYRRTNHTFAAEVSHHAPADAVVLVQDLHLTLAAQMLADRRPDVRTVHFSHTPFGAPEMVDVLPGATADELIAGMAAHGACGFHSHRWSEAFAASAAIRLGITPSTFVSPLPSDPDDLRVTAESAACARELEMLNEIVGPRQLIARVDRIELSKNLLRGFLAYERLLEQRPETRGEVVFVASVHPSREGLLDYLAYRREVETLVERINARWGTPDWAPIVFDSEDNYPRAIAVLRRYDVLLVNPVRDGLNLVAKEGPIVNDRDGVVLLSRTAGVWDELADHVMEVHPFDIEQTAATLAEALALSPEQRSVRVKGLRVAATARAPMAWLDDQLSAIGARS